MNPKLKNDSMEFLFESILKLQTVEECSDFFEDLCTINELQSISQRTAVAKMLVEGYVYSDIVKETGASTATISRVNRSLQYGSNGYDAVFKRMGIVKKEEKK